MCVNRMNEYELYEINGCLFVLFSLRCVVAVSHSNLICNQEFSVASNGPGVCVSIKSFWGL